MISSYDITEIHNTDTDRHFTISWKMTDWCNMHCPYCIMGKTGSPWIPENLILQRAAQVNKIINLVPLDKMIRLHFIGGEVTYYNLIKVLNQIDLTRVDAFNLITNFSQTLDYFHTLITYLRSHEIYFTLVVSYHEEFGSKKDFLDKIAKIKAFAPETNLLASVVIDATPDLDFIRSLRELDCVLNLTVLRDPKNNQNITIPDSVGQILNQFDRHNTTITNYIYTQNRRYAFGTSAAANDQIIEGGLVANNYWCTAGSTTVRILPNGMIVGAGCHYCQQHTIIGNIDQGDVCILNSPILCRLPVERRCSFCYKVNITKERTGHV